MSRFDRKEVERRFRKVERLIESLVQRFRRKYLIPRDDAWSVAGLAFVEAHRSYRKKYGRYKTWIFEKVKYRLMDLVRERTLESLRQVYTGHDLSLLVGEEVPQPFSEEWLWDRVSSDGRVAAMLVLEPPSPIRLAVRGKKTMVKSLRAAVKKYLKESGWDRHRIQRAFYSVRRGL